MLGKLLLVCASKGKQTVWDKLGHNVSGEVGFKRDSCMQWRLREATFFAVFIQFINVFCNAVGRCSLYFPGTSAFPLSIFQ